MVGGRVGLGGVNDLEEQQMKHKIILVTLQCSLRSINADQISNEFSI